MKNLLFIILLSCILLFNISCSNSNIELREADDFSASKVQTINRQITDIQVEKDFESLMSKCDIVILASYVAEKGTFDVAKMLTEKGYNNVVNSYVQTFYDMEIKQVFKGDVAVGMTLAIAIDGGFYNDVLTINDYTEKMSDNYEYVLFLNKTEYKDMPYQLISPLQGYIPLQYGKVSLNKKIAENLLINNGDPLSDVLKKLGG